MPREDYPLDPAHDYLELNLAIGKEIVCDDGKTRLVEQIEHSVGNLGVATIFSGDEMVSCHLVRLFSQVRGLGEPSKEEIEAFDKIASGFEFKYEKSTKGDLPKWMKRKKEKTKKKLLQKMKEKLSRKKNPSSH